VAFLERSRFRLAALLEFPLRKMAAMAGALLVNAAFAATAPAEYQVKAVFLFNFAHFVEWPAEAFASPSAPFAICILGRDPFGTTLDETIRGEMVKGRTFVVERYQSLAEVGSCQILYIDRSASGNIEHGLEAIERNGTLTVSDSDTTAGRDVVIRFMNENKKIRLRINVDSARNAGLTISSKLLRPAQVVGSVGTAAP
jgi:hypothetical protein